MPPQLALPSSVCNQLRNNVKNFALVGAGAVVNKDVPAYVLMVGVPARQIGWVSQYGEQLSLPLTGDGQAACPHTRQRYTLQNSVLTTSET